MAQFETPNCPGHLIVVCPFNDTVTFGTWLSDNADSIFFFSKTELGKSLSFAVPTIDCEGSMGQAESFQGGLLPRARAGVIPVNPVRTSPETRCSSPEVLD